MVQSFHFSWVYTIIHVGSSETSMSNHETTGCQGTDVCLVSTLGDSLNVCKLSLHLLPFYIDYKKNQCLNRAPPPFQTITLCLMTKLFKLYDQEIYNTITFFFFF